MASDYADNLTSAIETQGNDTTIDNASRPPIPLARILVCAGLFIIVIVTIVGNVIVIAAFVIEKKLRTTFTFYILNLAITDVCVAVTAMSFYTFDIVLGWWPFGEVMCGIWIFFDYGMTFASVFTLVAISVDRFWSVQWSVNYRQHNTMRKTSIVLFVI
ncbi:Muscarinic acetylcholine receptor M3, partial [Lamellibrachia satsuma]